MVCQLRIYTINRGMMDSWTDLFNSHIRPLHDRLGIPVINSWVNAADNEFIWVRQFNSREEIAGKEAEYFASPERVALGDLPTSHIAKMRVRVMEEVEGVQASGGLGRVFQQVLDDDPEAANIYDESDSFLNLFQGIHHLDQGEYPAAIRNFSRVIDLQDRDNPSVFYHRAKAFSSLGEYDNAIADCGQVIALKSDYLAEAYALRGNAYVAKGMPDQAEADFQQVRGLDNEVGGAIPNFDRYPERPTDHFGLGLAHLKNAAYGEPGFYQEAIENFSRAIELDPGFAEAYKSKGDAYLGLAEEKAESAHYAQAIADYSQAIALNCSYAYAYWGRGYAYYERGCSYRQQGSDDLSLADFDLAIADFNKVINLNPGHSGAYSLLGDAYAGKGADNQAIAAYTKVIGLYPDYVPGYIGQGTAYSRMGEYDLAIADFTQAIDRYDRYDERGDYPEQLFAAHIGRGDAYVALRRFADGILDFDVAIDIAEDYSYAQADAEACYRRGFAHFQQGNKYDLAIADFTKAIDKGSAPVRVATDRPDEWREVGIKPNSDNALVYHLRGTAHLRQSEYDLAIADFTQIIAFANDLDPGLVALAYDSRGSAYFQQGEYSRAVADYDKAVEQGTGNAAAYYYRGLAHRQLGNETQAAADLKRAAELDPNLGNP